MNESEGSENVVSGEVSVITIREESSDESTIISSQTSTLTRNQGQEEVAALAMCMQGQLNLSDDDEEEEEEEEDEDEEGNICDVVEDNEEGGDNEFEMMGKYNEKLIKISCTNH